MTIPGVFHGPSHNVGLVGGIGSDPIPDLDEAVRQLQTAQTDITTLTASLAALGKGIVQIFFASANNISLTGDTYVDTVTQAITTAGGMVVMIGWGAVAEGKSAANTYDHLYALKRDSTTLDSVELFVPNNSLSGGGTDGAEASHMTLLYGETPAAGTYTYKVCTRYNTGYSTSGTPKGRARLILAELSL